MALSESCLARIFNYWKMEQCIAKLCLLITSDRLALHILEIEQLTNSPNSYESFSHYNTVVSIVTGQIWLLLPLG